MNIIIAHSFLALVLLAVIIAFIRYDAKEGYPRTLLTVFFICALLFMIAIAWSLDTTINYWAGK